MNQGFAFLAAAVESNEWLDVERQSPGYIAQELAQGRAGTPLPAAAGKGLPALPTTQIP